MNMLLKCVKCNLYQLRKECVKCGARTASTQPMKFSDKYGKYRRMAKKKDK